MAKYNFLVVGAGLFGSVFAQQAAEAGKRVLVIERRNHVGGIAHCDTVEGIQVHKYGAHIFHTRDRRIWDYVNRFARFNTFLYAPLTATRKGLFNVPLNMNTFNQLWGTRTPAEAMARLRREIDAENIGAPQNMEERCLNEVGRELYELFLKDYLEKQWGVPLTELPPNAEELRPPRFTYDNRCYETPYQGIPTEGYDVMVKRMLAGCEVMLNTDYNAFGPGNPGIAEKTVYTGALDEYFKFKRGMLEYRTVNYKTEVLDFPDWQGTAIVNHADPEVPYIRSIEHKHFQPDRRQPKTVVTREYPAKWVAGMEPCYPMADEKNTTLYNAYRALSVTQLDVTFCGRLGTYRYYDMDGTVRAALELAGQLVK